MVATRASNKRRWLLASVVSKGAVGAFDRMISTVAFALDLAELDDPVRYVADKGASHAHLLVRAEVARVAAEHLLAALSRAVLGERAGVDAVVRHLHVHAFLPGGVVAAAVAALVDHPEIAKLVARMAALGAPLAALAALAVPAGVAGEHVLLVHLWAVLGICAFGLWIRGEEGALSFSGAVAISNAAIHQRHLVPCMATARAPVADAIAILEVAGLAGEERHWAVNFTSFCKRAFIAIGGVYDASNNSNVNVGENADFADLFLWSWVEEAIFVLLV